jgi:hypothetical protein
VEGNLVEFVWGWNWNMITWWKVYLMFAQKPYSSRGLRNKLQGTSQEPQKRARMKIAKLRK